VQKELKTFYDGTRKANLDVEIAVDMLSLAGRYDTAVLVSGDEDFVYAINAVAYKGCRVEVAGFRSNTAPRLIDVGDFFIDLGDIADMIRKDMTEHGDYDVPSFVPPDGLASEHHRGIHNDEYKRPTDPVPFDTDYGEHESEDIADFARARDDR
jgi:hypothetical protein